MSHMAKMEEELEQLQHRETHLQSYEKQIDELTKDALIEAEQLHYTTEKDQR